MTEQAPTSGKVTLVDHETGKQYDLPVLKGTIGPRSIDVRNLYRDTGFTAYDPGFGSTASCDSAITHIDGEAGILMHCGYTIEELADKSHFLEVCYLLLNGELPNAKQLEEFTHNVTYHTMVHDQLQFFFRGFRRDAHPMAIMMGVVGALSAFYHESTDVTNPKHREVAIFQLLAKMPTIAAMAYKYSIGQPFVYPSNELSFAANFIRMCFSVPAEDYSVPKSFERAMDRIFLLHADHGQNASTSTVRLAASSGGNPFACIAAGISSLWGPAHGGANEEVLKMLAQIKSAERIPEFIARAKDPDDTFLLMGFGHRVYKNYDPRASVLRQSCDEILADTRSESGRELLRLAMALEKAALDDPYFQERKLFPNVDFYSGIILSALGFPKTMFTVLFAVSRVIGWAAQWNEMMSQNKVRIGRPLQRFTGATMRPYKPINER